MGGEETRGHLVTQGGPKGAPPRVFTGELGADNRKHHKEQMAHKAAREDEDHQPKGGSLKRPTPKKGTEKTPRVGAKPKRGRFFPPHKKGGGVFISRHGGGRNGIFIEDRKRGNNFSPPQKTGGDNIKRLFRETRKYLLRGATPV